MGAAAQSERKWIVDEVSVPTVRRLWLRYQSVTAAESAEQIPFAMIRLRSLGVADQLAPSRNPTIIAPRSALEKIEEFLKDEQGRPLQKILQDDISSRVLVEIDSAYPNAQQLVDQAMELLLATRPDLGALLSEAVSWIVPIYHEKYNRPFRRGFSHMKLLGVIFTSFAERRTQPMELRRTVLAVDLAHELGHQALMLYQLADRVLQSPLATPVYSSVRKTSRPAIMSLHACVAASYMMTACRGILDSHLATPVERDFCRNSLAELLENQRLGVSALKAVCTFTPIGQRLIKELSVQTEELERLHLRSDGTLNSYFGLLAP